MNGSGTADMIGRRVNICIIQYTVYVALMANQDGSPRPVQHVRIPKIMYKNRCQL